VNKNSYTSPKSLASCCFFCSRTRQIGCQDPAGRLCGSMSVLDEMRPVLVAVGYQFLPMRLRD